MSSITNLLARYNTADALKSLSDEQVGAVIVRVLTVAIYADGSAGYMERMGARSAPVPAALRGGNADRLAELVKLARAQVEKATDPAALRRVVLDAACHLTAKDTREKVFSMAAVLTWATRSSSRPRVRSWR